MIANFRPSRPVAQERLLEVLPNLFRPSHNGLATGAQEQRVWSVELDDTVDVGVRECVGPLLYDPERVLFGAGDGCRAKRSDESQGEYDPQQFTHFPPPPFAG